MSTFFSLSKRVRSTAFATLAFAASIPAQTTLSTAQDGQVYRNYSNGTSEARPSNGQWWPSVDTIPSPVQESQVVLEFDLTAYSGRSFSNATLRYYVGGASAYSSVRLETAGYNGNGLVDLSDYDAGAVLGAFAYDAPSSTFPSTGVNQYVNLDVTSFLNARTGGYAGFNVRLQGDRPSYGGNVFDPNNPFRFIGIASNVNGTAAFRPTLTVTPVPEPASFAVLALGALALLRRRRARC